MHGRALGVALVLVGAMVAAGCASDPGILAAPDDEPQPLDESRLFSQDRGGIRGVVVDDTLLPVANASVQLFAGSREGDALDNVETDAQGAFAFGPLDPGAYRVVVEAPGFATISQLVQVVAGDLARLQVTLGAVPTQSPYVELLIHEGMAGCSLNFVWLVLGMPCDAVNPSYLNQFHLPMVGSWRYAVFQTDWETNDAMWVFAQMPPDEGTCLVPGTPCPGNIVGTPPVRFDGAPESAHGTDQYAHGESTYPPEGEDFDLYLNVVDRGMLYDELNNYGAAVCDLNGGCGGVLTTLEIRFTSYSSIFHWSIPSDPPAYSAIPDS